MLLRRHAGEVSAIEAQGEWLTDVDTPEEWGTAVVGG